MRCPKCGDKRITGAGSFVEIPIPDGDKQPDLRNPVQMLTVDRTSLDYNVEEEKRLRENIITAVVGQNEEVTQREAFNEQQVKAAFESQSTVLNRVKKGFEAAQQFVDETGLPIAIRQYVRICKSQLRHGVLFVRRKRVAEPLQVGKGKQAQVRQNWTPYKIRLSKRSTGTTQPNCNVC